MFSSPQASPGNPFMRPGALYRQVGIDAQLTVATPHQMVLMLFDGFLEAVALARGAMRDGRVQVKCEAIGRAVRIVDEGLRPGLDPRAAGTLVRDLGELYTYLVMRLTTANLRNDAAALDECQRLVQPLREAWLAIAQSPEVAR